MTTPLPKIWNTTFTDHSINVRHLDFRLSDNGVRPRAEISTAFLYPDGKPLPSNLVPEYIYFNLNDLSKNYRANTPDLFRIAGGIFVMSEKLHGLLARFDLGMSKVIEVPLFEFDQKTRRPGRWFIFHICETKDALVADKSQGLEVRGQQEGLWRSKLAQEDVLAVHASSADGADIWIDLKMRGRIFLSDRLKSALKPAGVRAPGMTLRPCIVVA